MPKLGDRWALVGMSLLVALATTSCGGGGVSSPAPLFADSFAGAFPGTAWTGPTLTGSAVVAYDPGTTALKMSTTAATATASTTTTMAFTSPPVTITMNIADVSGATSQLGTGTVTIIDATPAVVASAAWDNATGKITFHIAGAVDALSAVIPADGVFHHLVFSVNSSGSSYWSLDGAAAVVTQTIPAATLKLQLSATFGAGAAWPAFFFDNVAVTSP